MSRVPENDAKIASSALRGKQIQSGQMTSLSAGQKDAEATSMTNAASHQDSLPVFVQSNTINPSSAFVPVSTNGAYVAAPLFAAMNDGYTATTMRPAYEWQVDPVTGYLSGMYNGGLLTAQTTGAAHQQIAFGHAAFYGLSGTNSATIPASIPRWTGQVASCEHKTSWTPVSAYRLKVNSSMYNNRRQPRPLNSLCSRAKDATIGTHALSHDSTTASSTSDSLQSSPRSSVTQSSSDDVRKHPYTPCLKTTEANVSVDVLAKLANGKAIPPPIPSLFACPSPEDALEQSLYNPNRTTNVYIRGLPPDTTDDKLLDICERFGEITSSKAILEMQTNTCKGFGFACFKREEEAAACISGLLHCGYQVSFAKESFSTRLKNLQDPQSTNLYLSNLPPHMHEKDLETLFEPYKVISNRILRDSNNVSRGVGFARLSDRQSAEAIIQKFDNIALEEDTKSLPLQVRFADSPSQKKLKGQTQKRRQWRAREYNLLTGHMPYVEYGEGIAAGTDTSKLYMPVNIPLATLPYDYLESTNYHEHFATRRPVAMNEPEIKGSQSI